MVLLVEKIRVALIWTLPTWCSVIPRPEGIVPWSFLHVALHLIPHKYDERLMNTGFGIFIDSQEAIANPFWWPYVWCIISRINHYLFLYSYLSILILRHLLPVLYMSKYIDSLTTAIYGSALFLFELIVQYLTSTYIRSVNGYQVLSQVQDRSKKVIDFYDEECNLCCSSLFNNKCVELDCDHTFHTRCLAKNIFRYQIPECPVCNR